jgi:hypothetical protein
MKVPPHAITQFLGHSSVAFTQSTYGHLQTQMLEDARNAMDSLLATNTGKLGWKNRYWGQNWGQTPTEKRTHIT